jgi:hypothetical protein
VSVFITAGGAVGGCSSGVVGPQPYNNKPKSKITNTIARRFFDFIMDLLFIDQKWMKNLNFFLILKIKKEQALSLALFSEVQQ